MKVYYTLEFNKCRGFWVVWKNIESERGINFVSVYEGTKNECKEVYKRLHG